MSIDVIQWAFEFQGLSCSEKLVLVKLADNANDCGLCFPKQATIAHHCGLTRRGVLGIISRLKQWGILTVEKRPGRPSFYHLNMAANCVAKEQQGVHPVHTQVCTPFTPRCAPRSHPGVHPVHTLIEPSLEPSLESSATTKGDEVRREETEPSKVIRMFDDLLSQIYGAEFKRQGASKQDSIYVRKWIADGADHALIKGVLTSVLTRKRASSPSDPPLSLKYFDVAVYQSINRQAADKLASERLTSLSRRGMARDFLRGDWHPAWGPEPGKPGSVVSDEVLSEERAKRIAASKANWRCG